LWLSPYRTGLALKPLDNLSASNFAAREKERLALSPFMVVLRFNHKVKIDRERLAGIANYGASILMVASLDQPG
jgi:hypothetical protein